MGQPIGQENVHLFDIDSARCHAHEPLPLKLQSSEANSQERGRTFISVANSIAELDAHAAQSTPPEDD